MPKPSASGFGLCVSMSLVKTTSSSAASLLDGGKSTHFTASLCSSLDDLHAARCPPRLTPRGRHPYSATPFLGNGGVTRNQLQQSVSVDLTLPDAYASVLLIERTYLSHVAEEDITIQLSLRQTPLLAGTSECEVVPPAAWSDSVVMSTSAIHKVLEEWHQSLSASRSWKFLHSKAMALQSPSSGVDGCSSASEDTSSLSVMLVMNVFVLRLANQVVRASPTDRLGRSLEVSHGSRSPSNMSVNSSRSSVGSSSGLWDTFHGAAAFGEIDFWRALTSAHLRAVQSTVVGPALDLLEKQFDAAVEELVLTECTMAKQLEEKSNEITTLSAEVSACRHHVHAALEDGGVSHERTPDSVVADNTNTDVPTITTRGTTTTTTEAHHQLLKQKDVEIFLLRGRISAMEAARRSEVESLRDQLSTFKRAKELSIRKSVQGQLAARAANSRKEDFVKMMKSGIPQFRTTTSSSTTPRASSSKSVVGRKSSPAVRDSGRSLQTDNKCVSIVQPLGGVKPGSESPRTKVAKEEEKSERLRRLEESFARLQLRHVSVKEGVAVMGLGAAGAADALRRVVDPHYQGSTASTNGTLLRSATPPREVDFRDGVRSISPLKVPEFVASLRPSEREDSRTLSQPRLPSASTARTVSPARGDASSKQRVERPVGGLQPITSLLRTSPKRVLDQFGGDHR